MLIFEGRNRLTSGFRLPERPDHNGFNLVGDDSKKILAPFSGTVRSSAIVTDRTNLTWEWGHYVRIDRQDGLRGFFCHMESRTVAVGDKVEAGQQLGIMGNSGYSFGAHIHVEFRRADGTPVNPAEILGIPNKPGTYTEPMEGWMLRNGAGYYYENGNPLKSQWLKEQNRWYWLDQNGKMATGWITIQGKLYWRNTERRENIPLGACLITDPKGIIL